jgi:hypothetical protein
MAVTLYPLARVSGTTTVSGIYTVTSGSAIVTNLIVSNTTAASGNFTVSFAGVTMFNAAPILANSTAFFDMKQVLLSGQTINAQVSVSGINFHISGAIII